MLTENFDLINSVKNGQSASENEIGLSALIGLNQWLNLH